MKMLLIFVVASSMLLTPLLVIAHQALVRKLEKTSDPHGFRSIEPLIPLCRAGIAYCVCAFGGSIAILLLAR